MANLGDLTVNMSVVSFDDSVKLECERFDCVNHMPDSYLCNLKSISITEDGKCRYFIESTEAC
jgi:hypothetical protein